MKRQPTNSKQMSNGNCTHYAHTNFIICAHEVNGSSWGQRQASFLFFLLVTDSIHIYVQFFPCFNLCILMRQRVVFFLSSCCECICVWTNTCREAINTTQRPKSYKLLFSPLFSLLFFRIPNDSKKKYTKLNFPWIFPNMTIFTWKCVYEKKNTNGFLCECVC